MGRFEVRQWLSGQAGIDVPRADRWSGAIRAFVPDALVGADVRLSSSTIADVADAEQAILGLDHSAAALTNTEGLARLLLRAEAVASSNIEGLVVSPQRILRSDVDREIGLPVRDFTVREILANIDAMRFALSEPDAAITVDRLNDIHARLLRGTRAELFAGAVRTEQNWIGGPSHFSPLGAAYVPPPPELLPDLLADLCEFANGDSLPAVAQAAIAHAQFETLHPYADGNGRTGRALVYMVLRRRGFARRCIPPISLVLATKSEAYVDALQATRHEGALGSNDALDRWVALFAVAARAAVRDAHGFERRVDEIVRDWEARIADLRADAGAHALLDRLPETPIVTARAAEKLLGRTFATANRAIEDLVARGILAPRGAGSRNRTFEAAELIQAFTLFERSLASPQRDTRLSPPVRKVPARPRATNPPGPGS